MSEQEHTPGPWKVFELRHPHRFGGEHIERRIGTAWNHGQLKGPAPVVNMSTGVGTADSGPIQMVSIDEADAHLIAAAPELLEALRQIRDTCPTDPDVTREFNVAWALLEAAIAKAEGR